MDHSKYMLEAIRLSKEKMEEGFGGPFGAIVVKNGEIIGTGCNQVTSSNDPTAHAEIVAIREACKYLSTFQLRGCILYTSCEPCPMCLGAIYWSRLDQVFYANTQSDAAEIGFDDQFFYKELRLPLANRTIPFCQLHRQDALDVFHLWKKKEDKILY